MINRRDIILNQKEIESFDQLFNGVKTQSRPIRFVLQDLIEMAYNYNDKGLGDWVKKERDGYQPGDKIPEYRIAEGTICSASGANNNKTEIYEIRLDIDDIVTYSLDRRMGGQILKRRKINNNQFDPMQRDYIFIGYRYFKRVEDTLYKAIYDNILLQMKKDIVDPSRDRLDLLDSENPDIKKIEYICHKFETIAQSIKTRRKPKAPILMDDEYDVQYLMRALLSLYFDVIKPEEPGSTSAGSYSIIDFYLDKEKIGLEIKRLRKAHMKKDELKDELLTDIHDFKGVYKKHIFFIYDPDRYLTNPNAFVQDFNKNYEKDNVVVYYSPPLA